MLRRVKKALTKLHRDEQGADMVEYILIVAAIALPLLVVVIYFWGDIKEWMTDKTSEVFDEAESAGEDPGFLP